MRRKVVTVGIAFAALAILFGMVMGFAQQARVAPKECAIGTFNLEINHSGDDGSLDLDTRFDNIATIISSEGLQVVALQEVTSERMDKLQEDLRRTTSHNWMYLITDQTGSRVAVLFQADNIAINSSQPLVLHNTNHKQRDALVVNMQVLPNGFDFILVVVHLAAQDSDWRREQLTRLHQWAINQLDTGTEQDIIIAGDFNTPLLMRQEDFETLDGGMGFYIVQQDAGTDLYSDHCDATYRNPVDFLIISPDCRAEYIDNTASFGSYNSDTERNATSNHRITWAEFSRDDLDDPNSTPLVTSDSALTLDVPRSANPWQTVSVTATTFKKADCTIRVLYKKASEAKIRKEFRVVGDKKEVTWTWIVGGKTGCKTAGESASTIATVQVQATWKWGHALITRTFEIVRKEASSGDSQDGS